MSTDIRSEAYQSEVVFPYQFADLATQISASASRELRIISPDLNHAVFHSEALCQAVSQFARAGKDSWVRIIVADPHRLIQRGHHLLELARRIPSCIQLRKLEEHPEWNEETWLCADLKAVLYHCGRSENAGFYEPDSRALGRRFAKRFDDYWQLAETCTELRALSL